MLSSPLSPGVTLCPGVTWMTSQHPSPPLLPALTPRLNFLPDAIAVLKGSNNKKPQQFLGGGQHRHTLHCKKVFRNQSLYLLKYLE